MFNSVASVPGTGYNTLSILVGIEDASARAASCTGRLFFVAFVCLPTQRVFVVLCREHLGFKTIALDREANRILIHRFVSSKSLGLLRVIRSLNAFEVLSSPT